MPANPPPNIELDPALLAQAAGKTVVITGAANGIGAATAALFNRHGAQVVLADLAGARAAAEAGIAAMAHPDRALFVAADVVEWAQMQAVFRAAAAQFGGVDVVVANAGMMETASVLGVQEEDADGELLENTEAARVLDVNLKGTLNTLRLGLHALQRRGGGAIVLVASTSAYVGGTGVAAYVASKHGVLGLLRAGQAAAAARGVRLSGVAPFFTPTHITAQFADAWRAAGLEANTAEGVAAVVLQVALGGKTGECILTCGRIRRELEHTRTALLPTWMGDDVATLMADSGKLFASLGGYPLPKGRVWE